MKEFLQNWVRQKLKAEVLRPTTLHIRTPRYPGLLLDTTKLEILDDAAFLGALERSRTATVLDVPRLANLWNLSRMSNPEGGIIEVGSFRGGSALLLAEACPERPLLVCDTFEGFGEIEIHSEKDRVFERHQFDTTSLEAVRNVLRDHLRRTRLLKGYFPHSDAANEVRNISFAHLDCDLFVSMQESLLYLQDRFLPRSIIVVDDLRRSAAGVDDAVAQWTRARPDWCSFPIFPGQGLLIHKSWFA